jgi:hypothetical protein
LSSLAITAAKPGEGAAIGRRESTSPPKTPEIARASHGRMKAAKVAKRSINRGIAPLGARARVMTDSPLRNTRNALA